jgi:diguanylate cyclase (GGDEF)-like protein/PAS domain S-box-containing protein
VSAKIAFVDHDLDGFSSVLIDAVDSSPLMVVGIAVDGRIRFANAATTVQLGYADDELIGRNAIEFVADDEVERMMLYSSTMAGGESLSEGVTSFHLRHADGSFVPVQAAASAIEVGDELLIVLWARSMRTQVSIEELIQFLLSEPVEAVLRRVCDFVLWRGWGSQVGISWSSEGETHVVTTGMPVELAGGRDAGSPWASVRATGRRVRCDVAGVDEVRRQLATELDVAELLVEPLDWGSDEPALITIWTRGRGRTPEHHSHGLSQVKGVSELVLRFCAQAEELDRAAHRDMLTGLANRRTFFELVDARPGPGAVLYCDLDGFKEANDTFGHAAGDVVLRVVAERLQGLTRDDDLVARLGGDEFVVVCPGMTEAAAEALAARLRHALDDPIAVDGQGVRVGLSVGVVVSDSIDASALDDADVELYRDKRQRKRAGLGGS